MLRRRAGRAPPGRPRARLHRPRPAPRRPRPVGMRGAPARVRLAGPAAHALLALLFAERELLAARGGRPPAADAARRRDVGARLRAPRAARGARALGGPGGRHDDRRPRRSRAPMGDVMLISVVAGTAVRFAGGAGMRRLAPRPLDARPRRVSRRPGAATTLARCPGRWPDAVGPTIAAEASPVSERDGVVTVACRSAVWAQELELLGPDLVARLNELLGVPSGAPGSGSGPSRVAARRWSGSALVDAVRPDRPAVCLCRAPSPGPSQSVS